MDVRGRNRGMTCCYRNLVQLRDNITCRVQAFNGHTLMLIDLEASHIGDSRAEVCGQVGCYLASERKVENVETCSCVSRYSADFVVANFKAGEPRYEVNTQLIRR